MSDQLAQLEQALLPAAGKICPAGSDPKAVVHQWLNAIAYGHQLFGVDAGPFSERLIFDLWREGCLPSRRELKKRMRRDVPLPPVATPAFTFIDLFAGIGGFRLGFQQAGGLSVFSSEFDKPAQTVYESNFGEYPFDDITKIDAGLIPDHDVLLAGFPCQPFSHAGLKLGIDDTRGTLFHDIAKILQTKKPKFAVLENVKGLVSHDKGNTLQVILRTLSDIGYSCNISRELIAKGSKTEVQTEAKKMVLRAIDFGVPQNRQRIFIVLWRDGLIDQFHYPGPRMVPTLVGDVLEDAPDKKYTISDRLWQGHQRRKVENKKNGKGFGFGIVTPESTYTNTISARYYKDGSEILVKQKRRNPRKITPREAARLQGFPDNFIVSQSDSQAYRQFGNSVAVPVVRAVAKEIAKQL